jgi:hypothetical protein
MKTFTIENETNHITAHRTAREAKSVAGAESFATASALAGLAAHWHTARLVGIWNKLPGATPVRKFKDRATAVSRIWKAIQNFGEAVPAEAKRESEPVSALDTASAPSESAPEPEATPATPVAPQTPGVAAEKGPARTGASRAKKPPVAATKEGFRAGSKTQTILGLLNRPGGATLQQIIRATGWQAHSVRGFISGTVGKKMGLTVVSVKTGDADRTYSLEA